MYVLHLLYRQDQARHMFGDGDTAGMGASADAPGHFVQDHQLDMIIRISILAFGVLVIPAAMSGTIVLVAKRRLRPRIPTRY